METLARTMDDPAMPLAGTTLEVCEPFTTLCCAMVWPMGAQLRVEKQTSPNRLLILSLTHAPGGLHNVKRSTLRRCTRPLG